MKFEVVYDAFLAKILEDEWLDWAWEDTKEDLFMLLKAAMAWFKFPDSSLEFTEEGFIEELSNQEVQILSTYMVVEWLSRTLLSWENIKPLYEERDFSQANLLGKFNDTLAYQKKNAKNLEAIYYRSKDHKPFNYGDLMGRRRR